jgi:hypothetical protein
MRKKRWLGATMGCLLGCICGGLVATLVAGKIGYQEFLNSPRLEWVQYFQKQDSIYQLSQDQQGYVDENGYPASFVILFYQEEGANGQIEEVRHESWYYFDPDLKVTFVNGRFSQAEASALTGGQALWSYRPEMFSAYMTREQLAKAADLHEWLIVPVEENLVTAGEVYYADGLTFGLRNGKLIYVEAFAGE